MPKKGVPDSMASITSRTLEVGRSTFSASSRTARTADVLPPGVKGASRAWTTTSSSTSPSERCVPGSKARALSTSSPKSSRRTGRSWSGLQTSTTAPRTAKVPGSSTSGTRA